MVPFVIYPFVIYVLTVMELIFQWGRQRVNKQIHNMMSGRDKYYENMKVSDGRVVGGAILDMIVIGRPP